ncbi:MAG: hypothetical protein U9N62_05700 [Thermotogota bacterium]|nr:hypothetical protein [Thermotogota bacterium]
MESVDQAWRDSYIGTNSLSTEDFVDSDKLARKPFVDVALVAHQPGSGEPNFGYSSAGEKYLWRRATSYGLAYTAGMMPIIYQVIEDDLGFPGEAVGSVSPCFLLWRHDEPEPADSRGVFPTDYHRKVLFTKKVKLRTSDLPRWKPKAIIGLRTFEEEDV